MTTRTKKQKLERATRKGRHDRPIEVAATAMGAFAGAAAGAVAGPVALIAGALAGAAAGAAAGVAIDRDERRLAKKDAKLDADLGVEGGDIGAPNLKHPPPVVGAYSVASSGGGGATEADADVEGPIPKADA
jgi:hypothetical protein